MNLATFAQISLRTPAKNIIGTDFRHVSFEKILDFRVHFTKNVPTFFKEKSSI